jgi:hypothetical protein
MIVMVNFKDGDQDIIENVNEIKEEKGRRIELFDDDGKLLSKIDNKHASFTIKRHE